MGDSPARSASDWKRGMEPRWNSRLAAVLALALLLAVVGTASASTAAADRPLARLHGKVNVAALRGYSAQRLARARKRVMSSRRMRSKQQRGPAVSRFGVSLDNPEYFDGATRNRELDSVAAMGAKWVRIDVKWSDVQWDGQAVFNWSKYDPLVDAARSRGLRVLANVAYSPSWARPAGTSDKFGPDTDARRRAFATFAERAVRHFAGRVSTWELWNEPNVPMFWLPKPNASHYAALIRETYPRMKAVDPNAYILAGATAPAPSDGRSIDEVAFLSAVYAHGGGGRFDAWSHHPYTVDPSLPHPDNAWWEMAGTAPSIRSVMAAHGDRAKQLWGTEFGPPTSGAPHAVSEAAQAAQITEAYKRWVQYSWAGPLFVYTQRDKRAYGASGDSFNYYGMVRSDFSRKPAWAAYRALAT